MSNASWTLAVALAVVSGVPQARAQTFTTLHSFCATLNSESYCADGSYPYGGLIQGANGDLYGTTGDGGTGDVGTVFKFTTSGRLTTLSSFSGTDGGNPEAGLLQAPDGYFFGTTAAGPNGGGTVFKITGGGKLTTLYTYGYFGDDSLSALTRAANGDFYGTTQGNGTYDSGTVFKVTPAGALTTLYNFSNTDGFSPIAGLTNGMGGDLYGTTSGGGAFGNGTVFKITLGGTLTTLYSFCSKANCSDGARPFGTLVQATNGDFYGTTNLGGINQAGTVFKMTAAGKLTTLYSFCSQTDCVDGAEPWAGLIQASDGNLYGTTSEGKSGGTVFRITPSGNLTTLYSFCSQPSCIDGEIPYAGLVQASDGDFYGTTLFGGAAGAGTIFKLSLGLEPLVKTRTTSVAAR